MARNNRDAHSRYIQLATVGPHPNNSTALKPFVRTVVFRGLHNGVEPQDKVCNMEKQMLWSWLDNARPPSFVCTANPRLTFQFLAPIQHLVKMITDARSEKMAHLASYPHAEIAWYFVKVRL